MPTLTEGQSDKKGHFPLIHARARGQRYRRHERRDLKKLFLHHFFHIRNVSETCRYLHIARNTFYGWLQRDSVFKQRYDDLCDLFWPPPRKYTPPDSSDAENMWSHASDRALMKAFKRLDKGKW